MQRTALKNLHKLISCQTLEENQNVGIKFLNDLVFTITEEEKKNKHLPSPTFKPSSMKCPRNMYYQVTGAELDADENVSYALIGIGQSGTDRHIRLQAAVEAMKNHNIPCEYIDVAEFVKQRNLTDLEIVEKKGMETKLYNKKYNMSFMCDGIVKYHGVYYILEIKTEVDSKFRTRSNYDDSHTEQICAYKLNFGLDKVIMLYENRNICELKCYDINISDELMNERVIKKINYVNKCIGDNLIPRKHTSKTCQYCAYAKRCKRELFQEEY